MYKNDFLFGVGAFFVLYALRKPLKRTAVAAVSSAMALADKTREVVENIKEEAEDIVAEAKYENLKKSLKVIK